MPVTWSDEKLILLYCPGRGSNSRPSAHRGFKHGQGVPRPYSLGHGGGILRSLHVNSGMLNVIRIVTYYTLPPLESPDSFWIAMAFSR